MRPHFSKKSGFTLTELLVVIGLIGLLGTALGVALGGGKGRALATAQREVISALNIARMAAIKGGALYPNQDLSNRKSVAALVINVDSNSSGYLREFGVVAGLRNSTGFDTGSMRWRAVGPSMMLPEGVYFVLSDDASSLDADSSITDSGSSVVATSYPYFTSFAANGGTNSGANDANLRALTDFFFVFFDSDGTIPNRQNSSNRNQRSDLNLIMAVGEKNPASNGTFTISFPRGSGQVTGVRTVRYGNPIAITDPDDLQYR